MEIAWAIALITAILTWAAFAVCMRVYFRRAGEKNAAKDWLVRAAFACTAAQLICFAFGQPPSLVLALVGFACYALGNLAYWWALAAHGQERPDFACLPSAPSALTSTGPYRFIRHPIYAAYLLCWLAGPFVTGHWWLLATVLFMGVLYYRAARQEEDSFLAGPLADQYRVYQGQTGMFLPRLVRVA
jgi:protein-S-isoprenylcysteine O-methyltransferase Ste14